MTTTANTDEITIGEFEARTYAAMAGASRIAVEVAKRSVQGAKRHLLNFHLYRALQAMSSSMQDLLDLFHDTDLIPVVESRPDRLRRLIVSLEELQPRSEQTLGRTDKIMDRFWLSLGQSCLDRLHRQNEELGSHIKAIMADAEVVILSKKDQALLTSCILNPPEPSESLRRMVASQ